MTKLIFQDFDFLSEIMEDKDFQIPTTCEGNEDLPMCEILKELENTKQYLSFRKKFSHFFSFILLLTVLDQFLLTTSGTSRLRPVVF